MKHNKDFNELVSLLNIGDNNGKLCCIAGRPAMGKSALMSSFTLHCVQHQIQSVIFSLQMSSIMIGRRLISSFSGFLNEKIMKTEKPIRKKLEDLEKIRKEFCDFHLPLFIDDTPGITITEILKKVRTLKEERNIKVVFIDYLQLITTGEIWTSRKDEVNYILRELKQLSEDCQISIVVLSQLGKLLDEAPPNPENSCRQSLTKEYMSQFVCDTDSIDLLAFIHRPFYYQKKNSETEENNMGKEPISIIIEKDQDGLPREYEFKFDKKNGSIY